MITDQETNIVYFTNDLEVDNKKNFKELNSVIESNAYKVRLLVGTDDIYCRDYMPVQVSENDFVQFVFRPKAYLSKEEYQYISHPIYIELMNSIAQPRYSPIVLDGGNIIKWKDKAIITDRVLKDNRYQFLNDMAIIERLEFDLKCKVIIIPEYPNEATGHADGLIRFIDENTVFINDTNTEPEKEWLLEFLEVLEKNQLKYLELPCDVKPNQNSADGLYINYLHIGNLIVFPQYGNKANDKKAVTLINEVYGKTHKIIPFRSNWIAKNGGVLNCSSWTVKK